MRKPSSLRVFIDNNQPIHQLVVHLLRWKARTSPCPFCRLIQDGAPARVLYQDDLVTAFWDAHPASNTHILIVPNRHIPSLNEFSEQDELLSGRLFLVASQIARQENIHRRGYSLTVNTGLHAGQTVFHLHIHLKSLGD